MMILRSVAAVVSGIVAFSLLLLAAAALGNALVGGDPEWINRSVTTQIVWLIWNVVSMTSAGYITAAIALRAPEAHAVLMAGVQSLFTLGAMLTVTETDTPPWLWIAGIAATLPAAWAGARLRAAANQPRGSALEIPAEPLG